MKKLILPGIAVFIFFTLVLNFRTDFLSRGQTPKSLQFGSFTPDKIVTGKPINSDNPDIIENEEENQLEPDINNQKEEETNTKPAPPSITPKKTQPKPADFKPTKKDYDNCASYGIKPYIPQPRYLEKTSMCTDGGMTPHFSSSYVPKGLVNLSKRLGSKFWVRNSTMQYKNELTDNLKAFLSFIQKKGCVPLVGHAYRSYQEQAAIYKSFCAQSPTCTGAAPPGGSTHQAGIAVDLYCAKISNGSVVTFYEIAPIAINNADKYDFVHPVGWDTPHFVGL